MQSQKRMQQPQHRQLLRVKQQGVELQAVLATTSPPRCNHLRSGHGMSKPEQQEQPHQQQPRHQRLELQRRQLQQQRHRHQLRRLHRHLHTAYGQRRRPL